MKRCFCLCAFLLAFTMLGQAQVRSWSYQVGMGLGAPGALGNAAFQKTFNGVVLGQVQATACYRGRWLGGIEYRYAEFRAGLNVAFLLNNLETRYREQGLGLRVGYVLLNQAKYRLQATVLASGAHIRFSGLPTGADAGYRPLATCLSPQAEVSIKGADRVWVGLMAGYAWQAYSFDPVRLNLNNTVTYLPGDAQGKGGYWHMGLCLTFALGPLTDD